MRQFRRTSGRLTTRMSKTLRRCWPFVSTTQDERTFLNFQRALREGGTHVLTEAMLVLDIIDVKTQSLLSYISVSLAALVFLLTSVSSTSKLSVLFLSQHNLTVCLLLVIVALLVASVLCLSCLHIVGAHTMRALAATQELDQEQYEDYIVKVTLGRRTRYLIAHWTSVASACIITGVFLLLLLGSLIGT